MIYHDLVNLGAILDRLPGHLYRAGDWSLLILRKQNFGSYLVDRLEGGHMIKGFDRMTQKQIFVALSALVSSRGLDKIIKKIAGMLQDLELFISLCVARYIVWREVRRQRKSGGP